MSSEDHHLFPCDITKYDWKNMATVNAIGVAKYLIKGDFNRPKAFKLKILHFGVCFMIVFSILLFILYIKY